ncbi:MAG: metal-dependent hydrolase [Candidatus Bathyarchaeota archaeon]|nr:metal-dependent hydrolase [Candidatus Bathyarchaeota archaeon]MDH5788766.1 metal-dependent hydrolase [Candidatus Bathyarchaeota archaeon]
MDDSLLAKLEENKSFAVGHFAIGYISSKATAKILKTNLNIPIVLMLSVIPDIDILIPFVQHRGPAHSIITALIVFIPFFAIYRKRAIPYFIALIQHFLIGDYIAAGQVQLLWPLTTQQYGTNMSIFSPTNIALEWTTFLASIAIMVITKDAAKFFQPHNMNLLLSIPTFTVLLPTFLSFPLSVPTSLILPHLAYISLFLPSIIIDLSRALKSI